MDASHVLQFLSTASNETLGACIVGLAAATYLVLGRIGLVLIGVVGGIAIHASWESNIQSDAEDTFNAIGIKRRKELGLEVVKRVLDWREMKQEAKVINDDKDKQDISFMISARKELNFSDFKPATGAALSSLTDSIVRDYVKWWYGPILPADNSFPFACRQTLVGFLLTVSSYLFRKRPADTFLDFLTNSSSIIIVFFNELSRALMNSEFTNLKPSEAIYQYLEDYPNSNLASVLDKDQQEKKLKAVAEDILQTFLDSKAYKCEPIKVFLREILAGVVLETTVKSCSKAEWINGWIVYLLEEGEPELMNVIDAGVGGAAASEVKNASAQHNLNAGSAQRLNTEVSLLDTSDSASEHQTRVCKAEDAMDEAMLEAKRLSELIAAEDEKKSPVFDDAGYSSNTTEANVTPTSSQSDLVVVRNGFQAVNEEIETSGISHTTEAVPSFTSFDQILPSQQPVALQLPEILSRSNVQPSLTLYNASVSIFDDSEPGEKANIRSKPTAEYLLQIEPALSQQPGWMMGRKYADFETLHEVLRRISVVSGVSAFTEKYNTVPSWRNTTKNALRINLERYLRDALSYTQLAESEGMKRFLEKDQGLGQQALNTNKNTFGFPSPAAFESMGKGMLDVLASAPKGAAGGGKALLGGVTGVFGGQKKQTQSVQLASAGRSSSVHSLGRSRTDSTASVMSGTRQSRESQESLRNLSTISIEALKLPPLPKRPTDHHANLRDSEERPSAQQGLGTMTQRYSLEDAESNGEKTLPERLALDQEEAELHLPPPPSEIPDDYNSLTISPRTSTSLHDRATTRTSVAIAPMSVRSPSRNATDIINETLEAVSLAPTLAKAGREPPKPLTEQETQVAVELFFAVINELYTLSSAWTIRRTLLTAAKSFLLRPGNPNLEAIRTLLQDTMIDSNTSDVGLASHLMKLRENALPTEEELKAWPLPISEEDKEKLRLKARKLLVEKGMPQALTSIMGAAASGEALGRVFDCLQIKQVARGLMFALILQGIRAITQ